MTNLSLLSRSLIFTGSAVLFSTYINFSNSNIKNNLNNSLLIHFIILFLIFSVSIFPINKIRNSSFIDQAFIAEKIIEKISKNNEKENDLKNIKNDDLASINENDENTINEILESDLKKEKKNRIN